MEENTTKKTNEQKKKQNVKKSPKKEIVQTNNNTNNSKKKNNSKKNSLPKSVEKKSEPKSNPSKKNNQPKPKNKQPKKAETSPVDSKKKVSKKNPNQTNSVISKENKTKIVKSNSNNKKTSKKVSLENKPKAEDIKIFSLGGLGVVGMNMYLVEQGNELMIIDAGILFADDDIHGVNYIIPDFTYLEQNEKKIVGLFITHGHEDHIGAIPFLLKKVHIPTIYANGLAVGLIRNKMMEFPDVSYNITEFNDDSLLKFKHFQVSFFRTNHSIPDSFGIAIKTKLGYIVNTGDFKFDLTPLGVPSDFYKMARLGHEGVFCLLSESTNADIKELSYSERKIGDNLSTLFHQIKGRIIVATFASNVYRVQQIIEASIDCGRQVIVFGHSMELTIEVATRLKYINVPKGWVLRARDLKKIESEHVTILCTGSQGEPMAALSRIASGTHKQITIRPNDTVIYSSKPIPGNEQFINRNIDKIVHQGANVIINSLLTDTHTTGHASIQELKLMLSLMKPKYFVPVHGEYSMLKQHEEIAIGQGVPKENCFVLGPGDALALNDTDAKVYQHFAPCNDVFLDNALSDVDSQILKERKMMADDGVVNITYFVNKKKDLLDDPIISLNGFVIPDLEVKITDDLKKKSIEIYNQALLKLNNLQLESFEKQLSNQIGQYIYKKMSRNPVIAVEIKVVSR